MKSRTMLALAALMLAAGLGFLLYALHHPEGSFPWSNGITYTLYAVYGAVALGLLVGGLRKK